MTGAEEPRIGEEGGLGRTAYPRPACAFPILWEVRTLVSTCAGYHVRDMLQDANVFQTMVLL